MSNPVLKPLTNGAVTGTGTITMSGNIFGGCILNTDGTNTGAVIVRNDDASGSIIFDLSSNVSTPAYGPHRQTTGSRTIYYAISGTGADAQLYEWTFTKPGGF